MAEPRPAALDAVAYRVAEAEKAHARGWMHTPARGKRPFTKDWPNQPNPSLDDVQRWASAGNVGIRTGTASGLVVLDDDTPNGSAPAALQLPATVTVLTGGGHKQYYFRVPSGAHVGNSASKLAPSVDVRGDAGMVIAVGSIHPETGVMYEWAPGQSPDEIEMAELPEHVLSALTRRKSRPDSIAPGTPVHEHLRNYARVALQRHVDAVATVPEGQRNNRLNQSAFVLGRFIGAALLERSEVEGALHAAAMAVGLEEAETNATIRSGVESGMADPHRLKVLARKANKAAGNDGDLPSHPRPDKANRPVILIEGGKLPQIVDAAESALLHDGGQQLYQRENLLVRMIRASSVQLHEGLRRPNGALILNQIEPAYLVERFTRAASFQKIDLRTGDYRPIDCPERVAATYLARKGYWNVPALLAVVEAPTLRPDGSILQTPGYDLATRLYFDPGANEFALVPESPTFGDALAALARLRSLIEGFPFVEASDRSVALAAILTGLVRRSLRTAPLFAFRAPLMGSGKSLLADVVSMMATGRPVPAMPQGKDEDEDRKRMLALLIEGDPVCCIDNIEHPLASSSLCSILTQVTWKDRILGRTGTATVPTCTTWLATGNNLAIVGDLSTRALVCDLDAKLAHPEEREFEVNLHEYVPEHRGALVPAALTILRAYHLAGRPKQRLSIFGRFEGWSNLVRSALVWCGEADPCETRKRIEYVDPVRHQLQAVLQHWNAVLGAKSVSAAELVVGTYSETSPEKMDFRQALIEAVGGVPSELNAMRLGHWLAKNERRPQEGLRIERAGNRQGTLLWRVSRA